MPGVGAGQGQGAPGPFLARTCCRCGVDKPLVSQDQILTGALEAVLTDLIP